MNFIKQNLRLGKTRDIYTLSNEVVIVATDRISAFDKVLSTIPYKGQVLSQLSHWWFNKTRHIVPNHVLYAPYKNILVCKRCDVFPIEFVVRGYMTGSSGTSIWTHYRNGIRMYCGHELDDGYVKNQRLSHAIVTPTTKSNIHDELISREEIISQNIMTANDYDYCANKALELFNFGSNLINEKGLILVDTKYEFGRDLNGDILLIDEIHTPDSSRYWVKETYQDRFNANEEPDRFDKDILREWYKSRVDPYSDDTVEIPSEIQEKISQKYMEIYEIITGDIFELLIADDISILDQYVVIIMGSTSDESFVVKIREKLQSYGILSQSYVASAHKQPLEVLEILERHKNDHIVYVTTAGRSNGLGPTISCNCNKPVLTCPPFKDKTDMLVNINSSLQLPSECPLLTILDPGNCALAVKRIFDL